MCVCVSEGWLASSIHDCNEMYSIQDSGLSNSSEIYRLFKQSYKIVKAQNKMLLPSLLWVRKCGIQRESPTQSIEDMD